MEKNIKNMLFKEIAKIVIGSLFFILGGFGLIFIHKQTDNPSISYGIGIVSIAFGFLGIIPIYKIIKNHQTFIDNQEKAQQALDRTFPFLKNPLAQDLRALRIAVRNPILSLPFLISVTAIILFLVFEFKTFLISNSLRYIHITPLWLKLIFIIYVINFICFSIYMIGYLITGEILQRMCHGAKRNLIVDLFIDYFYAFPLILVLTLFWIIFLFARDEDEHRSIPASISGIFKSFSLYLLFTVMKYYTYLNLAIIAFEDKRLGFSLKESYKFFKKERVSIFSIWFKSGFLILIFLVAAGIFFMWNYKFHFINDKISGMICILFFFLWILSGLFSEQISLLLYYIKTRHPECKLDL